MQLYFHRKEYRLTDEQAGKLCWDPEDAMVLMEEGDTVVELIFVGDKGTALLSHDQCDSRAVPLSQVPLSHAKTEINVIKNA